MIRPSVLLLAAGLGLAALAPAAPVLAQSNNDFFGNLFKPPGQVRSGAATPVEEDPSDPGSLAGRVDRLENQLRQTTGLIEQLQYRNQQLEAQVKQLQGEIDFRLPGGASTAPGAAPSAAPPGLPPATPGQPARRSDAFDPNAQAAAPGAPRPLGTTAPSGPVPGQPSAPMDLGALAGSVAGAGASAATQPPGNSPKDLYDLAYGYMLRQDYEQSGTTFRQFLQQYPTDRAVPDAYYWLGETDYQRRAYKEAAQSFLKVSADYPNALKAPDALLRLGQSLAAIGEKDAACATFNAIGNKYPRASASIKQGVEREQKRVGC
ncbi:tol-pal system protein YbgF [Ancylobacter sp. A5.8]|uniref:tol-pal system protein YbgF n=1 Tax=Ancylobacter gelatini TaxID=2919920 RepID=UPI001F4D5C70|nr:tol-pal system protein YbgF [Ancylobacter gelatini]MCJ8144762.1 tol-pal system protein YbgF [Ancylobacter gelatini]